MPLVQITYDVPLGIAKGLATGELSMLGTAAVRNSTGIASHIREVSRTIGDPEQVATRAAKSLRDPKLVLGLGVLVAASVGGALGGGILLRRRRISNVAAPQSVQAYNSSLSAYLQAISTGALDADVLSELVASLNALGEESSGGRFSIEVSHDEARTLVNLVRDYARQLAEANGLHQFEAELSAVETDDPVVDLRRYLEVQQRIFTEAA
jgi:hypothetical protein